MQNKHKIPIVYYHSAGVRGEKWSRQFLSISVKVLEEHFRFISENYNTLFLGEFYEIRTGKRDPDKNNIIITFDDGYLDNWTRIFPLLKKFNLKATIFISPEFVHPGNVVRSNSDDCKSGKVGPADVLDMGFLSWDEMLLMEASGLVDIQCHTMSHTKYFISDRLIEVHHPGADILYPAGNLYPNRKPYYIGDDSFEKLLPYGYPIFKEASAVIARRVNINPAFIEDCVDLFKKYDFTFYKLSSALDFARPLYESYRLRDNLIIYRETELEYSNRLNYEIVESKEIIEKRLHKKVDFLCWPHGDNNKAAHDLAIRAGYLMTTSGNMMNVKTSDCTRMPDRMVIDLSSPAKAVKSRIKIRAFAGRFPWSLFLLISRGYHFRVRKIFRLFSWK